YLYKNRIRVIEKQVFHGLDKLEQLYLHFNDLATFDPDTFSNIPNLERLYLHFNKIENLGPDVFSNLNRLQRLFLHNNRLQKVPKGAFKNLHSLRRLRLDSNALVCDCQLMWLAHMVKEKQHRTQVAATCQFPVPLQGKSLTSITDSEFQCRGSPLITEGPSDVDVKFGGTAYFTCKVDGDPLPEVVWLHNNEVIDDDDRYSILTDGTLMIENAQDDDVGYYECMATNPMGEVRSRKAKMVPDEEGNEVKSQDHSDTLRHGTIINEPARENDRRGDSFRNVGERTETSRTNFVTNDRVSDSVVRSETDRVNTARSNTIRNNAVRSGDRIADARSDAARNNAVRSEDSRDNDVRSDTGRGNTVRSESNEAATNEADRFNAVQSETRNEEAPAKPRFLKLPSDVNITEGSPVEIECEASGVPRPFITWTKSDEPIIEGPRIQASGLQDFQSKNAQLLSQFFIEKYFRKCHV
ncbi:hypothetical protein SK128_025717, partial [Halocaridina rubra]